MRPIRPVHQSFARQPRLVQKIYFPKHVDTLGHDPLLTPARLPVGDHPSPFADQPTHFGSGMLVDVVNQ